MLRLFLTTTLIASAACAADPLAGTKPLTIDQPLDALMVDGIDRFALREIDNAKQQRATYWNRDFTSREAYIKSITPNRERFRRILGVVDERIPAQGLQYIATTTEDSLVFENDQYTIHAVRWSVLDGITAEGLFLEPKSNPIARVIAIPDADWTPEMVVGLQECDTQFAAVLGDYGCEVLIPTIINRDSKYSCNDAIGRSTNLAHREFIYRQAFELGRHIVGYEIQKILAGVDQMALRNENEENDLPIAVMGVSEGGLLALYSGALDDRIDCTVVSGYFGPRENVWQEPIYRNVWNLLTEFGDAEIASMIAPRRLEIENGLQIPEVTGPPPTSGRNIAAPGTIQSHDAKAVLAESVAASSVWDALKQDRFVVTLHHETSKDPPLSSKMLASVLTNLGIQLPNVNTTTSVGTDQRKGFSAEERQERQVKELVRFTQNLLRHSHRARDQRFASLDRANLNSCVESLLPLREKVYRELIGKLPTPTMKPNPRSRVVLETEGYTGYEVMLDVYPDVVAGGVLLLPNDMKADEKRPVVVCQHGLEGTPMDTISGPESKGYRAYKSFSAELVKQGYIVYAPQNPYRGQDKFRTLQRKSNPLGRSLFSYIIPQHLVTLRWLASLPNVDPDRIGFYGLSYGGKTAVRVPPMLPPTEDEPGYCLSICSADFNEWVSKNASTDAKFSYVWTGEYEIFEWNMGHVANYAELSMLMTPRPFMVERGHDDGVGIDEWVAWEYAKVRRHYNKLGIGDRTEIEFFDGPHTINGQGTYRFLRRHLSWSN